MAFLANALASGSALYTDALTEDDLALRDSEREMRAWFAAQSEAWLKQAEIKEAKTKSDAAASNSSSSAAVSAAAAAAPAAPAKPKLPVCPFGVKCYVRCCSTFCHSFSQSLPPNAHSQRLTLCSVSVGRLVGW